MIRLHATPIDALPPRTWLVVTVSGLICAGVLVVSFAMRYLGWVGPQRELDATGSYTCKPGGSIMLATHDCQSADPSADARAAVQSGDLRLLAAETDGSFVPGLPDERYEALVARHGVRLLYRGCVVRSEAEKEYRRAADAYAERYNQAILEAVNE